MSSQIPAAVRRLVAERAHRICEYCLIGEEDSLFSFQIEHIISEKHGGHSTAENLAYACVFCNRNKGSDIASISRTSGQIVRLFHPRQDQWPDHFSLNGPLIVARTEIGEATVRLLQLNAEPRIVEREALLAVDRYPAVPFAPPT